MLQLKFSMIILLSISQLSEMKPIRKITVMVSQSKPFAFYENHSLKGLDVNIIENFAKKFSLNIEYIKANDSLNEVFSTEEQFNSFSKTPTFSKIDIFIGALDESLLTKKYLIASNAYYHDYIIWCVQKAKPLPPWKLISHIFTDPAVFIVFILFAIFGMGLCYFVQQFERHPKWDLHRITVNGFQLIIGSGCTYKPKNFSNRMAFATALLGALVLNIILCTQIMTLNTTPIQDTQVKSITEAMSGGFQLVGDRFVYQKMLLQNQIYPMKLLNDFKIMEDTNEYINELQWNDKLAVAASYTRVRNDRTLTSSLHCFGISDHIYGYSLKFSMRRNFPLMNELNKFIQHASDSGLIIKWLRGNRFETLTEKPPQFQYITIGVPTFFALSFILSGMLLLGLLILIIEIIVDKKVRAENSARFWRYIEMSIDPYRYFLLNDLP